METIFHAKSPVVYSGPLHRKTIRSSDAGFTLINPISSRQKQSREEYTRERERSIFSKALIFCVLIIVLSKLKEARHSMITIGQKSWDRSMRYDFSAKVKTESYSSVWLHLILYLLLSECGAWWWHILINICSTRIQRWFYFFRAFV